MNSQKLMALLKQNFSHKPDHFPVMQPTRQAIQEKASGTHMKL